MLTHPPTGTERGAARPWAPTVESSRVAVGVGSARSLSHRLEVGVFLDALR